MRSVLGNVAFTLYEIVGYFVPGGIAFVACLIFYWTIFAPKTPLGIAAFRPAALPALAIALGCYVLGHAVQAIGNKWFRSVEKAILDSEKGSAPAWLRECARQIAIRVVGAGPNQHFEPSWLFRVLDEYGLQYCKSGDRDVFVYREGFYRGVSISLFFLSAAVLIRLAVPGAALSLSQGLFRISFLQLLVTFTLVGLLACLLRTRYRRFAEYRVTRAVLSAAVVQCGKAGGTAPEEKPPGG